MEMDQIEETPEVIEDDEILPTEDAENILEEEEEEEDEVEEEEELELEDEEEEKEDE